MKNVRAISSRFAVTLACLLCASALAQQPANPPAAPPAADKGTPAKTPEEKCMARSAKILEQCRAECAKDLDKQVRCTNHCEVASSHREAECRKPKG